MTDDDAQPQILISPIPPRQGRPMTVQYTGSKPISLEISWDPPGTPTQVTITGDAGTAVTVPSNASSVVVTDPTGLADAATAVVTS